MDCEIKKEVFQRYINKGNQSGSSGGFSSPSGKLEYIKLMERHLQTSVGAGSAEKGDRPFG